MEKRDTPDNKYACAGYCNTHTYVYLYQFYPSSNYHVSKHYTGLTTVMQLSIILYIFYSVLKYYT